ncbi:hypothetical protein ABK040_008026 [Willaertia magna]
MGRKKAVNSGKASEEGSIVVKNTKQSKKVTTLNKERKKSNKENMENNNVKKRKVNNNNISTLSRLRVDSKKIYANINELIDNFKKLYEESDMEKQLTFFMDETLNTTNIIKSLYTLEEIEKKLKITISNIEKSKSTSANLITEFFPLIETKFFMACIQLLLRNKESEEQENLIYCSLVRVLEFSCDHLVTKLEECDNSNLTLHRDSEQVLFKILIRHFITLIQLLDSKSGKGKSSKISKDLNLFTEFSSSSLTRCLNIMVKFLDKKVCKQRQFIDILKVVSASLMRTLSSISSRKVSTDLKDTLIKLFIHPYLNKEDINSSLHKEISYFIAKQIFDGHFSIQHAVNWISTIFQQQEEAPFQFIQILINFLKDSGVQGTKNNKQGDSLTLQVLVELTKSMPILMSCFLNELSFLQESPKGPLRKLLVEILGICITSSKNLNTTILNALMVRLKDRDSFVRAKAIQQLQEIGNHFSWSGFESYYSKLLDFICLSICDKTKTVRSITLKAVPIILSQNPFTSNFSLEEAQEKKEKITIILEKYKTQESEIIEVIGKKAFEKVLDIILSEKHKVTNNLVISTVEEMIAISNELIKNNFEFNNKIICKYNKNRKEGGTGVGGNTNLLILERNENELMELKNQMDETVNFLKVVYEKLLPKLYTILNIMSVSNSFHCKDSIVAIFSLFTKAIPFHLSIDWNHLINCCISTNIDDLILNEVSNLVVKHFFLSEDEERSVEHFILMVSQVSSEFRSINSWNIIFKNIKEKHQHVNMNPILYKCLSSLSNLYNTKKESDNSDESDMKGKLFCILVLADLFPEMIRLKGIPIFKKLLEEYFKENNSKLIIDKTVISYLLLILNKIDIKEDNNFTIYMANFIEENIVRILSEFPQETIGLIYSLPNNRRVAFYGIGKLESHIIKQLEENEEESSNDSKININVFISFIQGIGEVMYRNAQEIKVLVNQQYSEKEMTENDDELTMMDEQNNEMEQEENFLKENIKEQTKRQLEENAIDEAMTEGFLSRYLVLLKNIIKGNNKMELKSVAIVTIGKIMILSKNLALQFYPLLIECLENVTFDDEDDDIGTISFICNCLIVIADTFSILPNESEENSKLLFDYIDSGNERINQTALLLAKDLLLKRKCKAALNPHSIGHKILQKLILEKEGNQGVEG